MKGRIGAGLLAALLAAAAGADDESTRRRIEERLEKAEIGDDADVRVEVADGRVVLSGIALTLPVKREIERLAREEAKRIDNRIRVFPEQPVDDREIVAGVTRTILGYERYGVFDFVEFGVQEGAVLLRGSVLQERRRDDIEKRVVRISGVRDVVNEIAVQSATRQDRQLRDALARGIYGDPSFVQYANRASPPIRILVDRGRVTLAGYVATEGERIRAEQIARGFPAFSVENRLRVDASDREER